MPLKLPARRSALAAGAAAFAFASLLVLPSAPRPAEAPAAGEDAGAKPAKNPWACPIGDWTCRGMVGELPASMEYVPPHGKGAEPVDWPMGRPGAPVKMTEYDAWRAVECMALASHSEASGEPRDGLRSVAWTAGNRSRDGKGFTHPCKVVTSPAQYQGLDAEPYRSHVRAVAAGARPGRFVPRRDPGAMHDARLAAYEVLTASDADPTGGAKFFITKEAAAQKPKGHWARTFTRLAEFGTQIFLTDAGRKPAVDAPVAVAEAPKPTARMVHLASYKNDRYIDDGWEKLRRQFPQLARASEKRVVVDIPGKGTYIRLFAVLPDGADAAATCSQIKAGGGWCDVSGSA